MGVQLSLKSALPLAGILATVSDRCSKTGPWPHRTVPSDCGPWRVWMLNCKRLLHRPHLAGKTLRCGSRKQSTPATRRMPGIDRGRFDIPGQKIQKLQAAGTIHWIRENNADSLTHEERGISHPQGTSTPHEIRGADTLTDRHWFTTAQPQSDFRGTHWSRS